MCRSIQLAVAAAFVSVWALPSGAVDEASKVQTKTILSRPLAVDGIAKSMKGANEMMGLTLMPVEEPAELLWITSFASKIVEKDGETIASDEFMCHTNLDIHTSPYRRLMYDYRKAPLKVGTDRVFTLSPGVLAVDFPAGFGVPVSSHQPMSLMVQVMNHNQPELETWLRHKVEIDYVRDKDLDAPLIPLKMAGVEGIKAIDEGSGVWGEEKADPEVHGESCSIGIAVPGLYANEHTKEDGVGQKFTTHWVVKPGVEVNHTNATKQLGIDADTTLHYAVAHLHPFAEYIELNDLTAKKTVFRFDVEPAERAIGIRDVEVFSSAAGIPLYKDHQYQMVSRYNNTTDIDQDAMAVLLMYVRDLGFN